MIQRKVYCPCDSNFKKFYQAQAGHGFSDIELFRGAPFQRGYGIGSLFARFGIPILKYLGKQLLQTGVNVGQDVLAKKTFKEALKDRGKEALKKTAKDVLDKAQNTLNQQGQGIKRRKKKSLNSYKKLTKRRTKKDIFS